MPDIYVPINYSDMISMIPPGEDIIYSTLCKSAISKHYGNKITTWKWTCHALMTSEGVAYTSRGIKIYKPWANIKSILSAGRFGIGFITKVSDFALVREKNFESKEDFKKRSREFVGKFRPLLIEKKEEWLKLNGNNPEINKREIKFVENTLKDMIKKEQKRIAKEEKKKIKLVESA